MLTGRTLIGWSEIARAASHNKCGGHGLEGGAVEAASAGHDVVMTPMELLLP